MRLQARTRYRSRTTSAGHTTTARTELNITAGTFGKRVLKVDEGYVNPPDAAIARIKRETVEIEHLWTQSEPRRLWDLGFVRPVPGRANGAFGSRSIFNGQPRQPHGGADFLSPAGTPVHAPNSGRIVLARDLYFTGNTIVIDHGLGVFSLLAHLVGHGRPSGRPRHSRPDDWTSRRDRTGDRCRIFTGLFG
jgi:murein DD-endopeptidase MepM/ murein hydrolase activator NlpD